MLTASPAQAEPLTIAAYGDMPYFPGEIPAVERLIGAINALDPQFTIHIGDTKSGSSPCTDAALARALQDFARFQRALIYTPGDNEWTDCRRESAGAYDPAERLALLRKLYFADDQSLGQKPIALVRQSDDGGSFALYRENARWRQGNVLFATIDAVGSNNNRGFDAANDREFAARNAADLAWIAASFAEARSSQAEAVVFAMQADPHFERANRSTSGFRELIAGFASAAAQWAKPVLIIHGDSHVFLFDQPLHASSGALLPNVYRLEVPGTPHVAAVAVTIDPTAPQPFAVRLVTPPNNE
jgi:hypothetical protein